MSILRDNLSPMDFRDSVCKVTEWYEFGHHGCPAYRIWICQCTNHWFQRHEWQREGKNETKMDEWLYSGFYPRKTFPEYATIPASDLLEAG